MGSSENYCLRWNDFQANVSGSFKTLRLESDFLDVTLSCDGSHGRTLQAHKVILSACSDFFKGMLRDIQAASPSHPNPLIYLRGVQLADLESILDFMYNGEVSVSQANLNAFLALAEDLQVKGLTQQTKDSSVAHKRSAAPSSAGLAGSASKRSRPIIDDDIQELEAVEVKHEELDPGASTSTFDDGTETYDDSYEDYGDYEEGGEGAGDGLHGGEDTNEEDTKGKEREDIPLFVFIVISS